MALDDALYAINDYGRGQLTILFLLCFMGQLPASWHIFAIVFLGIAPDHFCDIGISDDMVDEDDWPTATPAEYSKCSPSSSNNESAVCDSWTYSKDVVGSTIVSEVRVTWCYNLFHINVNVITLNTKKMTILSVKYKRNE